MGKKVFAQRVLAVSLIIWGVLYFLYLRFFPKHISIILYLRYPKDELEQMQLGLDGLNAVAKILLFVILVVITIIVFIQSKNNEDKSPYSEASLIIGLVCLIMGAVGISWIFIIISGIIMLLSEHREKNDEIS